MPPPPLHPFRSCSLVDALQDGCDEIHAPTLPQLKMLQDHAPTLSQHDSLKLCVCVHAHVSVKCDCSELRLRVNDRVSR